MRLIDTDVLVADIGDAEVLNGTKLVHYSNNAIKNAPTIDAVPVVRGEWIILTTYATKTKYKCSVCGRTIMGNGVNPNANFPYCHCGAKMGA